MSDALLFVLTAAAAYRAWRFFAVDDLPPITALRERLVDATAARHGTEWADGVTCPWCSGFWVSAATVGIVWAVHGLPMPGLWFLAVPAAVALIATIAEA